MQFEWDEEKSRNNKIKHGIDFNTAKELWNDSNRVEIQTAYSIENRSILIGMIGERLETAIFTYRNGMIRIIPVRRSGKKEAELYGQKENG
jgi:uncharacterized DUF497 family protein